MAKHGVKLTSQVPFNTSEPQEKEGFLYKKGKSMTGKGYQQRYFILHSDHLYYFLSKPKNGKYEYLGRIALKDAELSDVEEPKHPNTFALVPPSSANGETPKTIWLKAETPLLKKEWLLYLTKKVKGSAQLSGNERKFSMTHDDVMSGLKQLYQEKMESIERRFQWDEFFGPLMRKSDFEALPQVLLLGQYSVGKTSFIEYLLHRSFPGSRIGPEPTTDRFTAIMYSDEERIIPGNALSVDPEKPFGSVNRFGTGFLTKFEASCVPSDILKKVTIIDTPGVLSGEKQRIGRDYDFPEVVRQFSDSAHVILLLFDAHKLDISDEFKDVIHALRDNKEKIKIILNKCDQVTTQQLVRIYGSLMWNLGKVINTPEVVRVYLGSFWDRPYKNCENEALFRHEQQDLLDDLNALPSENTTRKLNEMVKRARLLRAHVHVLDYLREAMPSLFGADREKVKLIARLPKIYEDIARSKKIPLGDFPPPEVYAKSLERQDFRKFKELHSKMAQDVDEILTRDLPRFMRLVVAESEAERPDESNPFDDVAWEWGVPEEFAESALQSWASLSPDDAPLNGVQLKEALLKTGASALHLKKIWALCDIERSGKLDKDEYVLALFLAYEATNGTHPPETLPAHLIPPTKRSKSLFRDRR